jgi:hypothetical protein
VACEALGRGQQILLLRKGGIREEAREFKVMHREFLLYPTYEHQAADLLKPWARDDLDVVIRTQARDGLVEIRYWASIAEAFEVSEPGPLLAVSSQHLWSDTYASQRLRWRPTKPLQLLALRVYRLSPPVFLPVLPEYAGCTSWLTLAEPVSIAGLQAALDDTGFTAQLEGVHVALGKSSAVKTPA